MTAATDAQARAPTWRGPFLAWRTVIGCGLALAVGYSAYIAYFFGLFVVPLSQELGWSRTEIALALSFCNLAVVFLAPVIGWLIDKIDTRWLIIGSAAAFSVACVGLAMAPASLTTFYALHVVLAVAALGTLPATFTRIIVAWFDKHRGLALGISLAGVGLGAALVAPLIQMAIELHGWRAGYLTLAGIVAVVALPSVFFLLRSTPSQLGLGFDGSPAATSSEAAAAAPAWGLPFSEAIKTRAFILLLVIFVALGIMTLGFSSQLFAMMTDLGRTNAEATAAVGLLGLSLIAGRIVSGLLLDRIPARLVAALVLAGAAAGLALIANGQFIYVGIALVGVGIGAEFDFLSYFISRYLGLAHYGKLYGLCYSAFQIGCVIGPIAMGRVFDGTGAYALGMWGLAIAAGASALLFLAMGKPPRIEARN